MTAAEAFEELLEEDNQAAQRRRRLATFASMSTEALIVWEAWLISRGTDSNGHLCVTRTLSGL